MATFDPQTIQYRNAMWCGDNHIDVEINHPVHGWIPYLATSDDLESDCVALYNRLASASDVANHDPTVINRVDISEEDLNAQGAQGIHLTRIM